ncbi:Polycomb protein suz12 [Nymphon striatum]|nr:Polycomb protein suz12 [Nymphon striatum]
MPPKKREKDQDLMKITPKVEDPQNDKELFLLAFEKPTQIYRFLRTRNLVSVSIGISHHSCQTLPPIDFSYFSYTFLCSQPLFLPRTLFYMKQRMSRNHKGRKNFKVDSILKKIEAKSKANLKENGLADYMTLTFTGFFSKDKETHFSLATVDAHMLKYGNKKRKDISSPINHVLIGKCDVPCNDTQNENHKKSTEAISIPTDSFTVPNNGYLFKSCILLLKVSVSTSRHRLCNGDSSNVPAKRLRRDTPAYDEDNGKRKTYVAELVVSDKHHRCLLTNGDYELILQEYKSKSSTPTSSSWETIADSNSQYKTSPFEVFQDAPTLKFQLKWNFKPVNGKVNMPCPISLRERPETRNGYKNKSQEKNKTVSSSAVIKQQKEPEKKLRIFYQFLYNNNTRQQTEAREDMHCPWCSVNCITLYSLLKHLKLGHSRFVFTYTPHSQGARIDVAISECYDGSYAGNPQDLHSFTGFAFTRSGPVRRTPVTNVIVCRPKRGQNSLSEFLEVDDPDDAPLPYVMGHNRLYYHAGSCLPIRPQEIDQDSDCENDPEWLKIKTKRMMDDFTDVNEGEKEVMKKWNLHIMHNGYLGDCQIPLACSMFVEEHGKEILEKNLYGNVVLHLCNLYDFGLISAAVLYKTVNSLQELKGSKAVS